MSSFIQFLSTHLKRKPKRGKKHLKSNLFSFFPSSVRSLSLVIVLSALAIHSVIFLTFSHNQTRSLLRSTSDSIEHRISRKLYLYQTTLRFIATNFENISDNNDIVSVLRRYQGHKIYLSPSDYTHFGSLSLGVINNDKSASYLTGTSLLKPVWEESYIQKLREQQLQISNPFQIKEEESSLFINLGMPFLHQDKIHFINMVLTLEEFLEDIRLILNSSQIKIDILDSNNQTITTFQDFPEASSKILELSLLKPLDGTPFKVTLSCSLLHFFQWEYALSIAFILISTCSLLFMVLTRANRLLKNSLEKENITNLKQNHEAFKEAVKDTDGEKMQLLSTYFSLFSTTIKDIRKDAVVEFSSSHSSSQQKYPTLWKLAEEADYEGISFLFPKINFNLSESLQSALRFHRIDLHKNAIKVSIEDVLADKELFGNHYLFNILLIRLLDYCLQDLPQGGNLDIRFQESQKKAIDLIIKSNGFGLNEQDLSHITFTAEEKRQPPFLCLFYSVETIAECLGADISISAILYKGREIHLTLPRHLDSTNPIKYAYPKGERGEIISLFDRK
jgi:hypothetical protein